MNYRTRAEQVVSEHFPDREANETVSVGTEYLTKMVEAALVEGAIRQEDGDPPTAPPSRVAKKLPKSPSRPQRWVRYTQDAITAIEDAQSRVRDLSDLRDEYDEWKGNLPENLSSGTLADKLEEVTGVDIDAIESALEEGLNMLQEAEGMDLPRGFGRD